MPATRDGLHRQTDMGGLRGGAAPCSRAGPLAAFSSGEPVASTPAALLISPPPRGSIAVAYPPPAGRHGSADNTQLNGWITRRPAYAEVTTALWLDGLGAGAQDG